MTRGKSAVASEACTSWSPGHLANATRIPRRYLQPPSDQRKLLDRPDAWFVSGFPNVPPSVLEDVRAHYVEKPRAQSRAAREPLSSRPVSPTPVKREEAFSSRPASPTRSAPSPIEPKESLDEDRESGDEGEEETPGTPIPWSPSSPPHARAPWQQDEEIPDMPTSTTNRHLSVQHNPKTTGNDLSWARYLTEFPPSDSAASESGLEVKVPKAVTEVLAPVNRQPRVALEPGSEVKATKAVTEALAPANRQPAAALEPTPPSAQIIPCTITEKPNLAQAPQAKHSRRWKPARYSSPDPVKQTHALTLPLPNTRTAVLSRSSSPVGSSPSPVLPPILHQPAEASSVVPSTGGQAIPASAIRQEVVAATSQLEMNQGSSNSTDKPPPNGAASQVPYTAFIVAYPDYKGSLGTFIRGVMCILPLQKDRALPEFLYDDFIRVFSTGFLQYIGSLDKNAHPLSAIQFYNENVSMPLYTKRVLTKENINDVTDKYPEESRAIRETLEKSGARRRRTRQAPDKMATDKRMVQLASAPIDTSHPLPQNGPPSAAASVTNRDAVTRAASPHTVPIQAIAQMPPLQEHQETDALVAASPDVSGPSSARQRRAQAEESVSMAAASPTRLEVLRTQVDSSPPHTRLSPPPKVTKINLPVASTFPGNMLSQISNPDSIPETLRKRRRVSTGPSSAEPGSEFKRQRTETSDIDKKVLQFRKFIQRRTQSSAPEQSTPS